MTVDIQELDSEMDPYCDNARDCTNPYIHEKYGALWGKTYLRRLWGKARERGHNLLGCGAHNL